MIMNIKITKLDPKVKLPERSHLNDVGMDIYAPTAGTLAPGPNVVGLGFAIEVPIGYQANIYPRSGHARRGIYAQIPPIDPGYTGEVHALIFNGSGQNYAYDEKERLGQLVFTPVAIVRLVEDTGKKRGDSAFNSTGR